MKVDPKGGILDGQRRKKGCFKQSNVTETSWKGRSRPTNPLNEPTPYLHPKLFGQCYQPRHWQKADRLIFGRFEYFLGAKKFKSLSLSFFFFDWVLWICKRMARHNIHTHQVVLALDGHRLKNEKKDPHCFSALVPQSKKTSFTTSVLSFWTSMSSFPVDGFATFLTTAQVIWKRIGKDDQKWSSRRWRWNEVRKAPTHQSMAHAKCNKVLVVGWLLPHGWWWTWRKRKRSKGRARRGKGMVEHIWGPAIRSRSITLHYQIVWDSLWLEWNEVKWRAQRIWGQEG